MERPEVFGDDLLVTSAITIQDSVNPRRYPLAALLGETKNEDGKVADEKFFKLLFENRDRASCAPRVKLGEEREPGPVQDLLDITSD